jgi:hypothetical protein
MGQTDATRIQTNEENNTTIAADLASTLNELDSRITSKDVYPVITRTLNLISKIEYYSDAAHTKKLYQREFSRTEGSDLVSYITGILTTFYNDDGSTDSVITTTITRNGNDLISSCNNVFSTSEPQC